MRTACLALMFLAGAVPLCAQTVISPPPYAKAVSLSGPRFGFTALSDGVVDELHQRQIDVRPAITQFGVDPAPGVAVNRIVSRQNDLALRLGAPTLRVLAPVPGRPMVGIEVPNTSVAMVKLGDLIAAPQFARA